MTIIRTLWRHKIASGLLIILVGLGCGFVAFKVPPTYSASGSYLLVLPTSNPPTVDQIKKQPSLAKVPPGGNPLLRYADSSVVTQVIAGRVLEDSNVTKLVGLGADPRFTVAPNAKVFSSPLIDVTSTADTAAEAIKTVEVVGKSVNEQLIAVQKLEDVDPWYMIKVNTVASPDKATARASGLLRSVLGVAGLGAILMIIMVAVLQSRDRKKLGIPSPATADAFQGFAGPAPAGGSREYGQARPVNPGYYAAPPEAPFPFPASQPQQGYPGQPHQDDRGRPVRRDAAPSYGPAPAQSAGPFPQQHAGASANGSMPAGNPAQPRPQNGQGRPPNVDPSGRPRTIPQMLPVRPEASGPGQPVGPPNGGPWPNGQPSNGQHPNGQHPNAQHPNAQHPNGQYPNGQYPNGQRPNGQRPNGQHPNGASAPPNAAWPAGARPAGAPPNGAPYNGAPANGARSNGQSTNGSERNGAQPNGEPSWNFLQNGVAAEGEFADPGDPRNYRAPRHRPQPPNK